MTNFANLIVKKPWGFEYEIYRNEFVSIWALHIDKGAETSLHCHPSKKTGLLITAGEAQCSFLNDSFKLGQMDKLMIRHGVFHSTKNIGRDSLLLLEIESPPMKEDIVRLKDKYGRAWQPYESKDNYKETPIDGLTEHNIKRFGDCSLQIINIEDTKQLFNRQPAKFMGISGGLYSNNYQIFGPADMSDEKTIHRLASEFEARDMQILEIASCY